MANTKSAVKNIRKSRRRQMINLMHRSRARTLVRIARRQILAGQQEAAFEAVRVAHSALDKAATKGVIHKNNASRRKARLMQQFNRTFESS